MCELPVEYILAFLYFRLFRMSQAAARPLVSVYSDKSQSSGVTVCLPAVFRAPVRYCYSLFYMNKLFLLILSVATASICNTIPVFFGWESQLKKTWTS